MQSVKLDDTFELVPAPEGGRAPNLSHAAHALGMVTKEGVLQYLTIAGFGGRAEGMAADWEWARENFKKKTPGQPDKFDKAEAIKWLKRRWNED